MQLIHQRRTTGQENSDYVDDAEFWETCGSNEIQMDLST